MIQISLISKPAIDYDTILTILHHAMPYNLTEKLDEKNIPVKTYQGFLALLGQYKKQNDNPHVDICDPEGMIRFLSFTFLCIATEQTLFELMQNTDLIFTCQKTVSNLMMSAFIHGTLDQWYRSIITLARYHVSLELRMFANKVQMIFEQQGLGKIFSGYEKRSFSDTTFELLALPQ